MTIFPLYMKLGEKDDNSVRPKDNTNINNNINNKTEKTNDCENKRYIDKSTQTSFKELYKEEEEEDEPKSKRKISPDLIRDKIFNYFNKMLYIWLITKNNNIEINQFSFEKNNKKIISETLNKTLKDLFISKSHVNDLDNTTNKILKDKVKLKYEDAYKMFISEVDKNEKDKKNEFYENFSFLEDFLKQMEDRENDKYISRVREVATRYHEWIDKKIHLFKKSGKKSQ